MMAPFSTPLSLSIPLLLLPVPGNETTCASSPTKRHTCSSAAVENTRAHMGHSYGGCTRKWRSRPSLKAKRLPQKGHGNLRSCLCLHAHRPRRQGHPLSGKAPNQMHRQLSVPSTDRACSLAATVTCSRVNPEGGGRRQATDNPKRLCQPPTTVLIDRTLLLTPRSAPPFQQRLRTRSGRACSCEEMHKKSRGEGT